MINIDTFRTFFFYILNKEGKGSQIRTSDFDIIANRANIEWTENKYGMEQKYQPGRPIPPIAFDQTNKISDDLKHLKENRRFNLVSGTLTYPDGTAVEDINGNIAPEYLHFSSLESVAYVNNEERLLDIRQSDDDEWHNYQPGKLLEATTDYPVFNFQSTTMRFLPKDLGQVEFTYLRFPGTAAWGFTIVNDRQVYNPGTSVDIDAPKEAFNEIVMMAISFTGIRLREQEVVQYAELQKSQGV